MSYPNEVQVSGIGGEHTVMNGDYLVSGIMNDKPYYDRYFNDVFRGRIVWDQSINYWLLINYDGSSFWKRIGTGDGPDGFYEPEFGTATGTATVTEYTVELTPSHPIEINSIVCTDAFIIENSLTGVDNSIF